MKRALIIILGVVVAAAALAQTPVAQPSGPTITWDDSSFDFGDIQAGDKVEHTFAFTNTGTEPLIITNVSVTCGCTLPKEWPRQPIAPGAKGEIVISFDSKDKHGKQNKVVIIHSNAVNSNEARVTFSVNVLEKKDS